MDKRYPDYRVKPFPTVTVALSKSTIEKLRTRQKVFPLSGKTLSRLPRSRSPVRPVVYRDLGTQKNISSHAYERSGTFHIIFIACKLVEMFSR